MFVINVVHYKSTLLDRAGVRVLSVKVLPLEVVMAEARIEVCARFPWQTGLLFALGIPICC